MKILLLILLIPLAGCANLPKVIQELSGDTNSVHIEIKTIYGSAVIDRNQPTK